MTEMLRAKSKQLLQNYLLVLVVACMMLAVIATQNLARQDLHPKVETKRINVKTQNQHPADIFLSSYRHKEIQCMFNLNQMKTYN